jgi:hypothetical protein
MSTTREPLTVVHRFLWRTHFLPDNSIHIEFVASIQSSEAGAFLKVNPKESSKQISDAVFITACRRRLYLPIFSPNQVCEDCAFDSSNSNAAEVGVLGEHATKCKTHARKTQPHDAVKQTVLHELKSIATHSHWKITVESPLNGDNGFEKLTDTTRFADILLQSEINRQSIIATSHSLPGL